VLPIELYHIYALQRLPFHHNDPFDRLIIAMDSSFRWNDVNLTAVKQSLVRNNVRTID
jgi:PIN domain nuclease of toxin-antitoxin system